MFQVAVSFLCLILFVYFFGSWFFWVEDDPEPKAPEPQEQDPVAKKDETEETDRPSQGGIDESRNEK